MRLTFEDLKRDPMGTLKPAFEEVSGQKIDHARLSNVIDQMDFAMIKTRETLHHKRKSQFGESRSLYTREAREVFAVYAQIELEMLGLERDHSWVDQPVDALEAAT